MRINPLQPLSVRNKVIKFTGGLNEEASRLSLKPGELDECKNYHETAGSYSGYASVQGYERFDGNINASSIPLDTAVAWGSPAINYTKFVSPRNTLADVVTHGDYTFYCILDHTRTDTNAPDIATPGDNTWWKLLGTTADLNLDEIDVNREFTRLQIYGAPGDNGPLLGITSFLDTVIVWANLQAQTSSRMNLSTEYGWSIAGIGGTTDANTFAPFGHFQTAEYAFSTYNDGDPVLVIVDGASYPRIWDGTTLVKISHANLPNPETGGDAPIICGMYNNRLFLGYEKGYLFFSAVNDPTDFDNIDATAGYIRLGDTLTNIVEAPGNVLVIICKNKITILKGNDYDAELLQWVPQIEEFSRNSGGFLDTAQRFMGDIYYADEEGITTMTSTDTYGDFNNAIISNKVQKTFLEKKSLVTTSMVDRHNNQYRLFFNDGTILYLTFRKEGLKGATIGEYNRPVLHLTSKEWSDGSIRTFFTSDTSLAYEMDAGTSFDGDAIETTLRLSYHHYGFTREWKFFQHIILESTTLSDVTINVKPLYDYDETDMPTTEQDSLSFVAAVNERSTIYLYGYGTNMALEFTTSSKYEESHILHNIIVDFTVNSKKL